MFKFVAALIFSFFLFTFSIAPSAQAALGPPNPKPCENVVETDLLTNNWITDENGNPPINQEIARTGTPGQPVDVYLETFFTVDFSKLQAIFGSPNSNYLEGRFQDEAHRDVDILNLGSADFNKFHGPGQKTAPKVMVDLLKIKVVEYVFNKPELAESGNKYSDIEGKNPKTIYELVGLYQLPDDDPDSSNPTPPSWGGDKDVWQNGWAKYWEKIPTAYNEFYEGKLEFIYVYSQEIIDNVLEGRQCPGLSLRTIKFNMPEFFRTTATSGQLNQVVVPKAAQPTEANNPILGAANGVKDVLGKIIQTCLKTATQNPLSKTLRNIIKVSFNKLNPLKAAFAQEDCIKYYPEAKEGDAPFCALPASQLQLGDSCINQDDPNKLDKNNPNVICTFRLYWQSTLIFGDKNTNPAGEFDRCEDTDGDGIADTCYIRVAIWPVFRIPYLSEIWNNTVYSDEAEGLPGNGVGSEQITGRPGVYTVFTPGSTNEAVFPEGKNLPNKKTNTDQNDLKQRFLGATDCNKFFTRDIALKPKALQEAAGISSQDCSLSALLPGPGPGPGPAGSLDYYIKYGDTSIGPQMTKQDLLNLASSSGWVPNNINAHYDEVISQSISRGISPAFAITIWWEEGGFGGAGANSEFGCFPGGDTSQRLSFSESFNCFLDFTANEHPYDATNPQGSFTEWVRYFCGPGAVPICSNNPGFIDRLEGVYNSVAPGEIVYVPN